MLPAGAGLLLAGAGVALAAGSAAPAAADPIGACSASAGALVVVDFGYWGGPTDVGCAPASGTGYDAMTAAGFITAGTQEDGPAFVCRIGLASEGPASFEPTASEDPCVDTPPVTAYWSYWHADAGQDTWSYSQQGFMSYHPPPGSIDAWVFGATNVSGTTGQPPFSPQQVWAAAQSGGSGSITVAPGAAATSAPPSSSAPDPGATGAPVTNGGGRSAAPTTSVAGGGGGAAATSAATGSGAGGSGPIAGPTTGPTRAGDGSSGSSGSGGISGAGTGSSGRRSTPTFRIVASPAGTGGSRRGPSGPPGAFVVGLAAVAVVGGAAGVVAWRRRHSG